MLVGTVMLGFRFKVKTHNALAGVQFFVMLPVCINLMLVRIPAHAC
jgi:hypothetical protein